MSDNKDNKKLGFGKASLGSAAGGGRPKSPRQPAPKEASQYRQLQASLISQVRRFPLLTLKLYRNILLSLNSIFANSERGI